MGWGRLANCLRTFTKQLLTFCPLIVGIIRQKMMTIVFLNQNENGPRFLGSNFGFIINQWLLSKLLLKDDNFHVWIWLYPQNNLELASRVACPNNVGGETRRRSYQNNFVPLPSRNNLKNKALFAFVLKKSQRNPWNFKIDYFQNYSKDYSINLS